MDIVVVIDRQTALDDISIIDRKAFGDRSQHRGVIAGRIVANSKGVGWRCTDCQSGGQDAAEGKKGTNRFST